MHRADPAFCFALAMVAWAGLAAPAAGAQAPAQPAAAKPGARGRAALNAYLDGLAAEFTAQRAARVAAIHTRAEAEARQAEAGKKILALIGGLPERTPLNARVMGETQADGFVIRKVLFASQPGFPVTALLYLPTGQTTEGKRAAILMTPGHYATGKTFDAGMAALFALNGFVVLSYDPIGQGERLQYPDPKRPGGSLVVGATGEHGEASLQPMLIGDTFARYEVWDAIRGVDYLSQLPEVDAHRIGAVGCSGGGAMTAIAGALDRRIAALGTACYITSFDALLPALGPQDAEQSSPGFLAAGLDFGDWVELAAPRPYAVISTYSDMFPFAGTRATMREARRFYALFDPASAGTHAAGAAEGMPPVPSEPAWNVDTTNRIAPQARLQFITGPGRHGALAPIAGNILSFFMRNLEPGADADHPLVPPAYLKFGPENPMAQLQKGALQVTPTGQVLTSFPNCETVFSLNRARARRVMRAGNTKLTKAKLAAEVRAVTEARARPGAAQFRAALRAAGSGPLTLPDGEGMEMRGEIAVPAGRGRHPAVLFLTPDSIEGDSAIARANKARFEELASAGHVVLAITPRPSPPGTDEMKAPRLGPFYLLSLRADLVGRTLLGLRVDDTMRAVDYLASRADVDPARISAVASGHMGLVLLHAAVLDGRLTHVTADHVLRSYRSLLDAPLPTGAPEDILPGVLLHYDIPDLTRVLGARLTETDALEGTADLSLTSTPLSLLGEK